MCVVLELGLIEYQDAYNLQRTLHQQRVEGKIPDILLILEHPPTITIGKSGTLDNVLGSRERLACEKMSLLLQGSGHVIYIYPPAGQLR